MEVLLFVLVLAGVLWVVLTPLRPGVAATRDAAESAEIADLEALKEAKYQEIRDAELDYRTGKISEADWRAMDRELRAEAIAILRRIEDE